VIGNIAMVIDFWVPAKADRTAMTLLITQQYHRLLADPTVLDAERAAPALPSPRP
jgi:hypothetical protein